MRGWLSKLFTLHEQSPLYRLKKKCIFIGGNMTMKETPERIKWLEERRNELDRQIRSRVDQLNQVEHVNGPGSLIL